MIALGVALFVIAVISALSYRSLVSRSEAAEAVNDANAIQRQTFHLLSEIEDAETGQRGYLLTGKETYLEPYTSARAALPVELASLREALHDDPVQSQRLATVDSLITNKMTELAETVRLERANQSAAALELVDSDRGKQFMDQIRTEIQAMIDGGQRKLAARTSEWESVISTSTYTVFTGIAVLLAAVIFIGAMSSRDFRRVNNAAWARQVQLVVANELQSATDRESIGDKVLDALVPAVGAQVGAIYAVDGSTLRRLAGHALAPGGAAPQLKLGEGLVGEAAKTDRAMHIRDVPADYLTISSAVGKAAPRELVILPASVDGEVHAVTELGFLSAVDAPDLAALELVSTSIALAVRTARERTRREALLAETQRQAEELQAQQEELRVSNEELEQQSKALQVSQAQLENQQAELEQINAQLEEQTQALESQRDDLTRAGAELQRSNDYKSQFLANMSHELRTPLNSTLILAKLLSDNRDHNLNPEQIEFAQTIYSAGNDLLTLINDILDLSKLEAGMIEIRPEPVAIARLTDELTSVFQPVAADKQLQLAIEVATNVPATFDTDVVRLQQILRNLLSNALKFTEKGGVTLEVAMRGDRLQFAVRDTGIGIAANQQDAIFEPFRQADAGNARKFGGTGLGLSISRDLSRLLGGDISVESSPGRGSTFSLSLPLRLATSARADGTGPMRALPADGSRSRRRPPTPAPALTEYPAPFEDDRVGLEPNARSLLIVEDDVAFARVLYDLAHELEFAALVTTTAEGALALARRYHPSAIVLDVGLPDRSGLAVLDLLKHDPRTRHVPVHMVSVDDHTRAALEMGAAGYALKPIERARLIEAIRRLEQKFTQKLRRVLIVEDDRVLRDSTARLLAAEDVETVAVGTTAEALHQLSTTTFDCIVLDLELPDRSGLEMLGDMASKEQYGFPPVIVYTGRSLTPDQIDELNRFSRSIIIKGARSPERLLDEVTLFLHQVESAMPPERQRMLRDARDREAVFEGRTILIAEDDVRNVFALTSVLEPKGARVQIARNGREAIAHLQKDPSIDLVLMDIMMPEMDGLEATRQIRADPRFAKLPIIALTAKAMIDDRARCLDAGANDYIAKPLDVDKLLSLARVWIRK